MQAGLIAGLVAIAIAPAGAGPSCAIPAAFAGWSAPQRVDAAGSPVAARRAPVGSALRIALLPAPRLRFSVPPHKPGGAGSYGGLVAFDVTRAGTYRVALSAPAWIDVVAAGRPVASSAHGHGPDCSTIRKIVDFPLQHART